MGRPTLVSIYLSFSSSSTRSHHSLTNHFSTRSQHHPSCWTTTTRGGRCAPFANPTPRRRVLFQKQKNQKTTTKEERNPVKHTVQKNAVANVHGTTTSTVYNHQPQYHHHHPRTRREHLRGCVGRGTACIAWVAQRGRNRLAQRQF